MLAIWARAEPHSMRARFVSFFGFSTTLPSLTAASTSSPTGTFKVPSLPLVVTMPPATSTVTPCGMEIGTLPMRDMDASENAAENLAADIGGAGFVVGHDAPRRRQDRDAEPVIDARQIGDARIDPPPRLRDTQQFADHRLAIHIFQLDLQLGDAGTDFLVLEAADIALALQHLQHIGPDSRRRRLDDRLMRLLTVADPGQHIPERIAHRHAVLPYQLDFTMPGIWPSEASSRSAMRESLNLR